MQPYIRLVEENAGNHIFLPRCINFLILWCYWAKWSVSFYVLYTVSCVLHETYKATPSCSVKSSNAFFFSFFLIFFYQFVCVCWEVVILCVGSWVGWTMGDQQISIWDWGFGLIRWVWWIINIVASSGWNKSGPSFTNGPGHLINNKSEPSIGKSIKFSWITFYQKIYTFIVELCFFVIASIINQVFLTWYKNSDHQYKNKD